MVQIPDGVRQKALTGLGSLVLVGGVGAMVRSWRDTMSDFAGAVADNPLAWIAVLLGVAAVVFANWDRIRRLAGVPPRRWRDDVALGNELHSWMRRAQYTLTDEALPGTAFAFSARDGQGKAMTILRVIGQPGVQINGRIVFDEPHKTVVAGMSPTQKQEMVEEIGLELTRLGIGFDIHDIENLGAAVAVGFIPSEKMTDHWFFGHVLTVTRAEALVSFVVIKHVRMALPEGQGPEVTVEPPPPVLTLAEGEQ
jgi:hypothetical protein